MAASIAFETYHCPVPSRFKSFTEETTLIRVRVNEKVVHVPGCDTFKDRKVCTFEEFESKTRPGGICEVGFEKLCNISISRPDNLDNGNDDGEE
jgi:hypothetical protein